MNIEPQCPYTGEIYVCILGNRYRRTDNPPKRKLPQDLDGLVYVGHCVCCVKPGDPNSLDSTRKRELIHHAPRWSAKYGAAGAMRPPLRHK